MVFVLLPSMGYGKVIRMDDKFLEIYYSSFTKL